MLIIYFLINLSVLLPINSANTECICAPGYQPIYDPTKHLLSLSDTTENIVNTIFETWDNLYQTITNLLQQLKQNNEEPLRLIHKLLNDEYSAVFQNLYPNLRRIKQKLQQFSQIYDNKNNNNQQFVRLDEGILRPLKNQYLNHPPPLIPIVPTEENYKFPLWTTIVEEPIIETLNEPQSVTTTTKPSKYLEEINNKIENFIDRMHEKRVQFDKIADNLKQYIDELLKKSHNRCNVGYKNPDNILKYFNTIKLLPQFKQNYEIFFDKIIQFIRTTGAILSNKDELITFLIKIINDSNNVEIIEAAKVCLQLLYEDLFKIDINQLLYRISPTDQDQIENNALNILNLFFYTEDFHRLIPLFTTNRYNDEDMLPTVYLMLILTNIDGQSDLIDAASYILTKKLFTLLPQFNTQEELELYTIVFNELLKLTKNKSVIGTLITLESDDQILKSLLGYIIETGNDTKLIEAAKFLLYIYDMRITFNFIEDKHHDIFTEDYKTVKAILQTKQVYDYLKRFNLTNYQDLNERFQHIIVLMLDDNSPIDYLDEFFRLKNYFNGSEGVSITKQLKLNLTKHFDEVFFKQLDRMTPEQGKDYAVVLRFITTHQNQVELGDFDFDLNDTSAVTIKKFFEHLLILNETIVPINVKTAVDELIKLVS